MLSSSLRFWNRTNIDGLNNQLRTGATDSLCYSGTIAGTPDWLTFLVHRLLEYILVDVPRLYQRCQRPRRPQEGLLRRIRVDSRTRLSCWPKLHFVNKKSHSINQLNLKDTPVRMYCFIYIFVKFDWFGSQLSLGADRDVSIGSTIWWA